MVGLSFTFTLTAWMPPRLALSWLSQKCRRSCGNAEL
jgi:hypothetical protein